MARKLDVGFENGIERFDQDAVDTGQGEGAILNKYNLGPAEYVGCVIEPFGDAPVYDERSRSDVGDDVSQRTETHSYVLWNQDRSRLPGSEARNDEFHRIGQNGHNAVAGGYPAFKERLRQAIGEQVDFGVRQPAGPADHAAPVGTVGDGSESIGKEHWGVRIGRDVTPTLDESLQVGVGESPELADLDTPEPATPRVAIQGVELDTEERRHVRSRMEFGGHAPSSGKVRPCFDPSTVWNVPESEAVSGVSWGMRKARARMEIRAISS